MPSKHASPATSPRKRAFNSKTIVKAAAGAQRQTITSGEQLQNATSFFDSQSGTPAVSVRLNSAGGQRMYDYTKATTLASRWRWSTSSACRK